MDDRANEYRNLELSSPDLKSPFEAKSIAGDRGQWPKCYQNKIMQGDEQQNSQTKIDKRAHKMAPTSRQECGNKQEFD